MGWTDGNGLARILSLSSQTDLHASTPAIQDTLPSDGNETFVVEYEEDGPGIGKWKKVFAFRWDMERRWGRQGYVPAPVQIRELTETPRPVNAPESRRNSVLEYGNGLNMRGSVNETVTSPPAEETLSKDPETKATDAEEDETLVYPEQSYMIYAIGMDNELMVTADKGGRIKVR
jgi:hypothetical protein